MAASRNAPELTCDEARVEVRAFLGGSSVGAKSPALRAHLAACVECDSYYRERVVGMARIASGARGAALVRHQDEVEATARRSLIAAETQFRFRLPKSLLPLAVLGLIVLLVTKSGANGVNMRCLEGTVYRGAQLLAPGERIASSNGDGCSTGVDGRAELARGADTIRIEPETSFTIERTDRLAIRLFDGRAYVTGNALIVFTSGALEVEAGSARIAVDDVGISVEASSGNVEFTDAMGRTVIPPGGSRTIEHVHVAAHH
jgi:hypothetical protein